MAKGIHVRETQSGLFFRAFLQNSSGLIATSGTAQLAIYQLNYTDGGLLAYDFNDDTFKSGVLASGLIALTQRAVNSGNVNTGIWTYRHTVLTNFTAGTVCFGRVIHSGASPYDQVQEFQYGGAESDVTLTASGFVRSDVEQWFAQPVLIPTISGLPKTDAWGFGGLSGTFNSGRAEVNTTNWRGSPVVAPEVSGVPSITIRSGGNLGELLTLSGKVSLSGTLTADISGGVPTNFNLLAINNSGQVDATISGGFPLNFARLNIDTSGKIVVGSGAVLAQVSGGVPANFPALAITAGGLVSVSGAVSLSGIPTNWSLTNIDTSGKLVMASGPGNVSGNTPTNFNLLSINGSGQVDALISGGFPTNFARTNIDTSGKVVVGSGAILAEVSGGVPTNFPALAINGAGLVSISGAVTVSGIPANWSLLNIDASGKVVVGSGVTAALLSGGVPANFTLLNIDSSGKVVAGSGVFNPTSGSLLIDTFASGVIRYLGDVQLIRNISGLIEGSGALQSLASVILKLTSRFDAASGMTFRCDGTTLHMTQVVTTGSGMTPIRALGVAF